MTISSPESIFNRIKNWLGKDGITAFFATAILGIITHMAILTSDIPNHDGLFSMYFDQNMITSGRWFLGLACGISSFHSIPWVIGILSILYLSISSVVLCKLLNVKRPFFIVIISGILISFPSVASYFAYVFTMDGYMLGLLLGILSVYVVNKYKLGFLPGAVLLALSLGTYQAFLPIVILLCLYKAVMIMLSDLAVTKKVKSICNYALMGIIGGVLYYAILKILLFVEGKELDSYQGIDQMASSDSQGILYTVKQIYSDFFSFTIKGHIVAANIFAWLSVVLFAVVFTICFVKYLFEKKAFKSVWFYIIALFVVAIIPVCTNIILIVSSNVTYHLLMRYQWAFFAIIGIGFINEYMNCCNNEKIENAFSWLVVCAGCVIIFSYILSDNIGYSNLQKKYEKTYAYCLRLADRIEQVDEYYQGIPICMIGVVGDESYPSTSVTGKVTGNMLGLDGDFLLYTGENYEYFFKYFMGITFNILEPEEVSFYYEDWYRKMPSFPAKDSVKYHDGIIYIKTENME